MGVMTGYNLINGYRTCDNKHIINDVLKDEWGFKGVVMTDWVGSGANAKSMIKAGLDIECPTSQDEKTSSDECSRTRRSYRGGDRYGSRVLYVTCYGNYG